MGYSIRRQYQKCFQDLAESVQRRVKAALKANGVQPITSRCT